MKSKSKKWMLENMHVTKEIKLITKWKNKYN